MLADWFQIGKHLTAGRILGQTRALGDWPASWSEESVDCNFLFDKWFRN
jgi:hypothetical protein